MRREAAALVVQRDVPRHGVRDGVGVPARVAADDCDAGALAVRDDPAAETPRDRGDGRIASGRDDDVGVREQRALRLDVAAGPVRGDDGRGELGILGRERAAERRRRTPRSARPDFTTTAAPARQASAIAGTASAGTFDASTCATSHGRTGRSVPARARRASSIASTSSAPATMSSAGGDDRRGESRASRRQQARAERRIASPAAQRRERAPPRPRAAGAVRSRRPRSRADSTACASSSRALTARGPRAGGRSRAAARPARGRPPRCRRRRRCGRGPR